MPKHLYTVPHGFKLDCGKHSFHTIPIGAVVAIDEKYNPNFLVYPKMRLWNGDVLTIRRMVYDEENLKKSGHKYEKLFKDFKKRWEEYLRTNAEPQT